MSTAAQTGHQPMPAGIPYIVTNEFAERFCYYGINAILSVYMVNFLYFGEAQATTWQSLFKSAAYFFPVLGAIISDVFLGKYKTIMIFSSAYVAGCAILALGGEALLPAGLFLVALGTGGIKPCVSTHVGDQFTSKNQGLIERAFSWFYLAINAGSLISIFLCPILLPKYGPEVAFGLPAIMMAIAVWVFWLGRNTFQQLPPAGKEWFTDVFSGIGLPTIGRLLMIYLFVAFYWSLWEQSNGQTWVLQAQSELMDKHLGFGIEVLPAQIQMVNALFILLMVPVFTYLIYPVAARFCQVTPLRKIGAGLFVCAGSFMVIAWIESRIQAGIVTSVWWQILAYAVLTASEVMVSITALEFSYKQAPLKMKAFIMSLFLLSTSLGNLFTAGVNSFMVRDLEATAMEAGAQTWVSIDTERDLVEGQKIDLYGENGLTLLTGEEPRPLTGTFLIAEIEPRNRVRLIDPVRRDPVVTEGQFTPATASTQTYALVGPQYFMFFSWVMIAGALIFIVVAMFYKERTYVREDEDGTASKEIDAEAQAEGASA